MSKWVEVSIKSSKLLLKNTAKVLLLVYEIIHLSCFSENYDPTFILLSHLGRSTWKPVSVSALKYSRQQICQIKHSRFFLPWSQQSTELSLKQSYKQHNIAIEPIWEEEKQACSILPWLLYFMLRPFLVATRHLTDTLVC